MQEVISIQNFGGMMTNPHKEDIPDNMAIYAYNVDPQAEMGVLKGVQQKGSAYLANNVALPDTYEADWIKYERSDVALDISGATNANPIVITVTTNHNLVTGDKVVIAGVLGNTAANGTWRITVIGNTTFSIPTAGNGSYIAPTPTTADTATYTGGTKWDLIRIDKDNDNIDAIEDFYNSTTDYRTLNSLVSSGIVPECVKTFNNAAQIGNGTDDKANVAFRLLENKTFFDGDETVRAGVKDEYGECYNASSGDGSIEITAAAENDAAGGYFQAGIYYKWAVSLVYDGLQESNLSTGFSDVTSAPINGTADYYDLTITADEMRTAGSGAITNLDARVTAVKVYRAESSDGQVANLGLFRFVDEIDINDGWGANNWTDSSRDYVITFRDSGNYPAGGATYEEETGMPETLVYQSIRYAVNEVGGGYHWVTAGEPEGESDADWQRYIFRSKKFRPNMFDWTRDFLVLPDVPTSLAWYNDRLYAFSENAVYRINPELMYVEDTFFGAGAKHKQSVLVSEYGLYFCNVNGAYLIQDSGIVVISDPISETPSTGSYLGWRSFANVSYNTSVFGRVVIKAEADKRLVLFIGGDSSNKSLAFGYYIPTGQWYIFSLGAVTITDHTGYFGGKDGEVYLSEDNGTYRLFAKDGVIEAPAAYESSYTWVSKEFTLNEPSQNKSWNMIKWDAITGSGYTVAVTYGVENTDPATSATSGAWINVYNKSLQVKIAGTISGATNAIVHSLDIIVRRLFGKR